MITQQAASFLIKKMERAKSATIRDPTDGTDRLFAAYLHTEKTPIELFDGGKVDNLRILNAFKWRAAELSHRAYVERVVEKKPWTSLLIQLHRLSQGKTIMIYSFKLNW
jgi:acyl-CoA oxidase